MIRNAQPSQYEISGDTNTRGRSRSPILEPYTQTVFGEAKKKIRSELLPPAAADCAWGVRLMVRGSKREDDKLSTKAGQLHRLGSSCHVWRHDAPYADQRVLEFR